MPSRVVLVLLGIAIAVNGCGGSGAGGTGGAGGAGTIGGNGGGSAGAAGGGGGTGGATNCSNATGPSSGDTCNVIAAGGPCVTAIYSTAAAPTPAGGAFAGGTYNLTSETIYGPADLQSTFLPGVPFRRASVLSNVTSTSFTLDQIEATGTIVLRSRGTMAVSGMTATLTQTCPAPDAGVDWGGRWEFTATSSSITLFLPLTNGLITVDVFDKAP